MNQTFFFDLKKKTILKAEVLSSNMDEETRDKLILARAKSWTPDLTILLREWRGEVDRRQTGHSSESRSYSLRHYIFGVPAAIIATIVATGGLATFRQCSNCADLNSGRCQADQWIRLVIAVISIFSAGLVTFTVFMNYQKKAEQHQQSSADYEALSRRIQTLLILPEFMRGDPPTVLLSIREKYDLLVNSSPSLPGKYSIRLGYHYKVEAPSPDQIHIETESESKLLNQVLGKKRKKKKRVSTPITIDLNSISVSVTDDAALAAARLAYLKEQEIQRSKALALKFELQRLEEHAKGKDGGKEKIKSENKKLVPGSSSSYIEESHTDSEEEEISESQRSNDERV